MSEKWSIFHGDCIPHMAETMQPQSVDMAIFSPPFPSLFAYTSSEADIGNTDTCEAEARIHLSFFYKALARVLKPGRVACVHVCQIPRMKRSGGVGLCDFRGINIRIGERAGLVYEYDWCIRKNPMAQAIRTKARDLTFAGLENDRAASRGAIADYIIKFRAPGENVSPITSVGQVNREQWKAFAEAAWFDIRETNTLNTHRGDGDTKHIVPLQLDVIDRCVRLFSDPGELVFSPFAGVGSEGVVSLKLGRRFYGCELKDEYARQARKNLAGVVTEAKLQPSLFGEHDEIAVLS